MSTYVLIHGSLIGGWCWKKVKKVLENYGHTVYAPDLPGHSHENTIAAKEITLNKYVSFICEFIDGIEGKVILAGHSLGGAIITNAAEYIYGKIDKLVYICALVPKDGDTIAALMNGNSMAEKCTMTIDKDKMHIEVDVDKIDGVIFNDCDKDDVAYAKRKVVPQPFIPFIEPIAIKKENYKKIDRVGIVCTEDRSLSPAFQEKTYKDAGCKIEFLKSGHAPYFSQVEELCKILLSVA